MSEILKYHAYTMYDFELGCGCEETKVRPVYDHTGNNPKIFYSKESAEAEAIKICKEREDDRWSICRIREV